MSQEHEHAWVATMLSGWKICASCGRTEPRSPDDIVIEHPSECPKCGGESHLIDNSPDGRWFQCEELECDYAVRLGA